MPYTVWSRGRLIGETELGFPPVAPESRMGWLRPVPGAESLVDDVALPSRDVLAFILLDDANANDEPAGPDPRQSTLFADYAESMQRQMAFALELRDADGAVVATSSVMIQDTERLRQLARIEDPPPGDADADEVPFMMEMLDSGLAQEIDRELGVPTAWWDEISGEADAGWSGDTDLARPGERYQVIVLLEDTEEPSRDD